MQQNIVCINGGARYSPICLQSYIHHYSPKNASVFLRSILSRCFGQNLKQIFHQIKKLCCLQVMNITKNLNLRKSHSKLGQFC